MTNIKVKSFPAGHGDSFLILICYGGKEYSILIDCGFKYTYTHYIKKELENIKRIDLLVLTHIDDDHIRGAIELFKDSETINNIEIKNIWFNDLYKIANGKYIRDIEIDSKSNSEESLKSSIFDEEVSYRSAKCLSNYIIESKHSENWNKNEAIVQCKDNLYEELYPINDKIKFVLLSPQEVRINELLSEWCDELGVKMDDLIINNETINLFHSYFINSGVIREIFDEDCSVEAINIEDLAQREFNKSNPANNASIAFFIEINNKRLLFLGDSNSEDIKSSLQKYIQDKNLQQIKFDLVKLSHHGSRNNITSDFFKIFSSDIYLVSSNGSIHNHPDIECLCKIIVKQKQFKNIIFNYNRNSIVKELDNKKLKGKYLYELSMPSTDEDEQVIIIDI